MFKFSISFLRIILLTSAIFILTFILGAHFHKDSIWPFGKGYYAEFKLLKKYGLNYKEVLKEKDDVYRTTAHLINIKKKFLILILIILQHQMNIKMKSNILA